MQPFQMSLSQNQKTISQIFTTFPGSTSSLEYFETKDEPQRRFLSEIIESKWWGYLLA